MNENDKQELNEYEIAIKTLLDYQEKTGLKRGEIAKKLNTTDSILSQFLSKSYPSPHTLYPKIQQLMAITAKKNASYAPPAFSMTTTSKKVIDIISYCHTQDKIGVAYGDAGIGKTMAIREYIRNFPDSVFITISPCFATIAGVNELLASALRIKERLSRRVFLEVCRKLKGSNRVIIIDEAQHLTVRVINHLRCIADESDVGIAFVGNYEIYLKMKGSGNEAYAQLYSRIGNSSHLTTAQIKKDDIKNVFSVAELDEKSADFLHKISKSSYGLRGAVNVFVNALIGFNIKHYADLNSSQLTSIAKEMGILDSIFVEA